MGDLKQSKVNKRCRLCLSENLDSAKSALDDRSLRLRILTSVGVKVQQGDTFPTIICIQCVNIIKEFYDFKQRCLENQLNLEQWHHFQNNGDGLDTSIIQIEYVKKELPLDHDVVMIPVISNVKTEPSIPVISDVKTEPPKSPRNMSSGPICDEKVKDEKVINPMSTQKIRGTKCVICLKNYSSNNNLRRHYKKTHAADTSAASDVSHVKSETKIPCKHCKIQFATPDQLKTHMKTEHLGKPTTGKTKQYVCKTCQKIFSTNSALCSHEGWHKREKTANKFVKSPEAIPKSIIVKEEMKQDKVFQCNTCGSSLSSDTALQTHILEKHRNVSSVIVITPPRCAMCNLKFKTQEEYDRHQQFHTAVDGSRAKKTYPCCYCTEVFTILGEYSAHIVQTHKYFCNQCDRAFGRQSSLSNHLKAHENQKAPKLKFSCSICNKGFQLSKDLTRHTIQAHPLNEE